MLGPNHMRKSLVMSLVMFATNLVMKHSSAPTPGLQTESGGSKGVVSSSSSREVSREDRPQLAREYNSNLGLDWKQEFLYTACLCMKMYLCKVSNLALIPESNEEVHTEDTGPQEHGDGGKVATVAQLELFALNTTSTYVIFLAHNSTGYWAEVEVEHCKDVESGQQHADQVAENQLALALVKIYCADKNEY